MKHLLSIIAAFVFALSAQAQLYRLVLDPTDFKVVQSGTSSNATMLTNSISSTRYLTTGTGTLLGRGTAGSGAIEQITLGTGLSLSGTTLNSSPGGTAGTVINTGASVVGQIPNYLDTSGTNIGPLALTGFLYGNGAGAATAGTLSGDITSSGFVTTLKNTGTAGTYTSVTTDAQGRVTAGTSPATSHNWVDLGATNSTLAGIGYEWGLVVTNVGATKIMGTDANGATTNVILSGGLSYSGNTLTGFGGTVGTVVNTGASVANAQLPTYTDTTGTNISPITATNGLTIQGGSLYVTNIQANQLGFSIGGSAGNMVNSGASTATQYPKYTDTTGTNLSPDTITLASADFANQGTTTTVLHGNAAGNPSFGQVALGTDVSGTLLAAQFPALTGDITTSAGALATTLKNTGTAGTYTSVTTDAQGRVTSGSSPTSQTTLDNVLADGASSSINNAAFTNEFRYTDPGAGKKSFAIKGTNSTASTTFSVSGKATSATAILSEVTETTASTGGSGSQDLLKVNTLAASTANPLRVMGQATNIFVAYGSSGQILAGDANGNQNVTYPVYSFLLNQTYGIDLAAGGYLINVINGTERFRVDSQGVKTGAGSVSTPAYSFTASTSSGLYSPFTGTAGLAGGGTLVAWATNSVFQSTNHWINLVPYTWPTAQGAASTYLKNDGSGGLTWASVASGASLDAVTADAASSSINNGAFTNQWYWTDPGASKNSFAIKGTNSTASSTLRLSGQMTSATAAFVKIDETTASTSGANSQYLLDVETLSGSTANPFRVATRGFETFRVDQASRQILAADGDTSSLPTYSFASTPAAGMLINSSKLQLQKDTTHWISISANTVELRSGADITMTSNGVDLYDGADSDQVISTGSSTTSGLGYKARVATESSGTVALSANADGNVNASGSIHNATGAVTYTTAATPKIGDIYTVLVNTGSTVTVSTSANSSTQRLRIGSSITTANTGTATSSTQGSTITFTYVSTDLWIASYTGTWSIT